VYIYIYVFISVSVNGKYPAYFICQTAQNLLQSPLLCSVQESLSTDQCVSTAECWRTLQVFNLWQEKKSLEFCVFAINSSMGNTPKNLSLFSVIS